MALKWRCHMGVVFWPTLLFSCITQWKVMPPSKTCSQIRFLIFRHPLVPLFQQSRKSDLPFLSVKVNHCLCIETSQIGKTPKGPPPLWKMLSPILLKFYMRDPLTIRFANFGVFFKIFFQFLFIYNTQGTQKNFDVKISIFLEKTCQKWLYWILANTKMNKVMNFHESDLKTVDMVNRF